jgi:uncharacterized protein
VPGVFLTAEWRDLLIFNYAVDPAILAPYVPEGTELDDFHGQHLVSMVGFRFLKTSVLGIPALFHRGFDEVNLRFYVRHRGPEGWRRGVVFIKEIVPKWLISFGARTFYNEAYVTHPMRSSVRIPGPVRFEWNHAGGWDSMSADALDPPETPHPESEAFFTIEHYWGYTRQRDGSTKEYQVEHPPWQIRRVAQPTLNARVASLYGDTFARFLTPTPHSAILAEGSAVQIRRGERLLTSPQAGSMESDPRPDVK